MPPKHSDYRKMEKKTKLATFPYAGNQTLPLTPPGTVEKYRDEGRDEAYCVKDIRPKKLFPRLKSNTRKPRLKYRPSIGSTFNVDDYTDGLSEGKDAKNADFIRYAFKHSKRMVVITGAGISVAAGIPDFRSTDGLFALLKGKSCASGKDLFDFNKVYSSDEMSVAFNSMITKLHRLSKEANPTGFHELLEKISMEGKLQRLYTQNIDGLDTRLTNLGTNVPLQKPAPMTIQLHGSINHMVCNKCGNVVDLDPGIFKCDLIGEGEATVVPSCQQCEEFESVRSIAGLRLKGVGKLRPRVVLYNEIHPEGDIIGEITGLDLKKKPDCLIIAGTSLQIPGVKSICKQFAQKVRSSKGIVLYLNKEMPSRSIIESIGCIDLIVLGDCQNVPKLLEYSEIL